MTPLSNYQRYKEWEYEFSGQAAEDLRRRLDERAIDDAAIVAAKAREAAWDLDDDDTRIDARTRWRDGEGEVLSWA